MINRSCKPFYDKLDRAHILMLDAKTSDEKVALANYIGNVYRSLMAMGDDGVSIDQNRCFGSKKNYKKFVKKIAIYDDRLLQNFVLNKEFHSQFLGEILPDVEDDLARVGDLTFPENGTLSKEDFFEVFYLFLKSISLDSLFDEFYEHCHIHSSQRDLDDGYLGFTLYNPLTKETDLFVRDFRFDFSSMQTLAHEFGHGYDVNCFSESVEDYNRYFYLSFYGEVLSRLMERLLFHFMIQNGILRETVSNHLINFESINHDFLLYSYIISLLDSNFLLSEEYLDCDEGTLAKKVKKFFVDDADIKGFLERMKHIDLAEGFVYAYGDIVSMFLSDEAQKVGFSNDLLDYFLQRRSEVFQEDFFRKCGFGPVNYVKLYKKEIGLIQK